VNANLNHRMSYSMVDCPRNESDGCVADSKFTADYVVFANDAELHRWRLNTDLRRHTWTIVTLTYDGILGRELSVPLPLMMLYFDFGDMRWSRWKALDTRQRRRRPPPKSTLVLLSSSAENCRQWSMSHNCCRRGPRSLPLP